MIDALNSDAIHPDAYLSRLGAQLAPAPTLEFVAHLQMQHLLNVPFENLSVMAAEPIRLDVAHLYHKIVERRRGGFCYELNGLFGALLSRLGFPVQYLSAQVYQSDRMRFGPPFDHLTLCVEIDATPYLVDVGFGDSFRSPIALPIGNTGDISGTYRVRPARPGLESSTADESGETENAVSLLILEAQGDDHRSWVPHYRFSMEPHPLSDFEAMCRHHSSHRESGFTRRRTCSIATPSGRYTLSNDRLILTCSGTKRDFPIQNSAEYERILWAYFGVCNR